MAYKYASLRDALVSHYATEDIGGTLVSNTLDFGAGTQSTKTFDLYRVTDDSKLCYQFVGGSNHSIVGDDGTTLPSDYITVAAWVKITTSRAIIFGQEANDGNGRSWYVGTTSLKPYFRIPNASGYWDSATTTTPLTTGVWTHLGFTFDRVTATAKIYVNGVDVTPSINGATSSAWSALESNNRTRIGNAPGGDYADMLMDDWYLNDRVITPTEMANLATARGAMYELAVEGALTNTLGGVSVVSTATAPISGTSSKTLAGLSVAATADFRLRPVSLGDEKGWWYPSYDDLGNGTTTLYDQTTYLNDATVDDGGSGLPMWIVDYDSGGKRAIRFDGSNDKVEVAIPAGISGGNKISMMYWFKRTSISSYGPFFGMGVNLSSDNRFIFQPWNDGFVYLTTTASIYAYIASNDTNWHHLAVSFDGTQTGNSNRLKMWLDGVAATPTFAGTFPTTIGAPDIVRWGQNIASISGAYQFGRFDDSRIYAKTVDTANVLTVMAERDFPNEVALDVTMGGATLVSTGTVADPIIVGSLSITTGGATLSSTATSPIAATSNISAAGLSLVSSAVSVVSAAANITMGALTSVSSATAPINSTLTTSLTGIGVTATGTSAITGSFSKSLEGITVFGALYIPPVSVGDSFITLADLTVNASSDHITTASVDKTLSGLTVSGTATSIISAQLSNTLGGISLQGTGVQSGIQGTLSSTLAGIILTSNPPSTEVCQKIISSITTPQYNYIRVSSNRGNFGPSRDSTKETRQNTDLNIGDSIEEINNKQYARLRFKSIYE